jgi:hypothetical protein
MARFYLVLFFFSLLMARASAQTPADSIVVRDTAVVQDRVPDTAARVTVPRKRISKPVSDSLLRSRPDSLRSGKAAVFTDSLLYSNTKPKVIFFKPLSGKGLLESNDFLNFSGKPLRVREETYEAQSYDGLFYLLVGMLFFFAVVKRVFGKYLGNLLTLFFRVSMRQQQIREQVLQSPFPSLLLNLLFVLSGGLYLSFLLRYNDYGDPDHFWLFFLYTTLCLTAIYLIKFVFLKMVGWIFNIQRPAETYVFIVFMTNKIIGIFLLPFLIILSLSTSLVSGIAITVSAIMVGIFYIYRIIASYKMLRKEINISGLHFFLYLCAFEIAPLLLIYKVLLNNLGKAF